MPLDGQSLFEALRLVGVLAVLPIAPRRSRRLADRAYERLKEDPSHPSLHFKKVGRFRSVKDAVERGSIRRGPVFYMEEVLSWVGLGSGT